MALDKDPRMENLKERRASGAGASKEGKALKETSFFPAQAGGCSPPPEDPYDAPSEPEDPPFPPGITAELLELVQIECGYIADVLLEAARIGSERCENSHAVQSCEFAADEIYYLLERLNACVRLVQVHQSVFVVRGAEPAWWSGDLRPVSRAAHPARLVLNPPQSETTSHGVQKPILARSQLQPSRKLVSPEELSADFDAAWDSGAFDEDC